MKKRLSILGITVSLVAAIVCAYFYAKTNALWLLICAGSLGVVLLGCVAMLAQGGREEGVQTPVKQYRKKRAYLTAAECEFLAVLSSVVPSGYTVCVQAPLVSVVEKVSGGAFRNELFRVIDFLIMDKATTEPLVLIELNDASHNRADRIERDQKVAQICASAKIPLLSFSLAQARDIALVRKTVSKALR